MISRLSRSRRRSLIDGRRGRRGCLLLRGGRLVRVRQERNVRVAPGHQSWYVWLSVTIVDKSHGQERRTYPRCRNRPLPIGPQLCWSDLWRNDILWFSGALEQFLLLLYILWSNPLPCYIIAGICMPSAHEPIVADARKFLFARVSSNLGQYISLLLPTI